MGTRSKQVDAYVARQPDFARPILEKVRSAFHQGCPGVVETMKWGAPHFEHQGLLGGMAAFKAHVNLSFWKGRLLEDPDGLFGGVGRTGMVALKMQQVADVPPARTLARYVKAAVKLNEAGVKLSGGTTRKRKGPVTVPADLKQALAANAQAKRTFDAFPPSCRREYVEWITEAKKDATRARRLATTLEWLAAGKRRNWKYESC